MSIFPHSIGFEENLETAISMMDRLSVRHLPVIKAGTIVGIISDRDVKLACSLINGSPEKTKVKDFLQEEVFIVNPEASLEHVVAAMALRKIGSAVVVDNEKLVGIFTAVDALLAFSDFLRKDGPKERHYE